MASEKIFSFGMPSYMVQKNNKRKLPYFFSQNCHFGRTLTAMLAALPGIVCTWGSEIGGKGRAALACGGHSAAHLVVLPTEHVSIVSVHA